MGGKIFLSPDEEIYFNKLLYGQPQYCSFPSTCFDPDVQMTVKWSILYFSPIHSQYSRHTVVILASSSVDWKAWIERAVEKL